MRACSSTSGWRIEPDLGFGWGEIDHRLRPGQPRGRPEVVKAVR